MERSKATSGTEPLPPLLGYGLAAVSVPEVAFDRSIWSLSEVMDSGLATSLQEFERV